MAAIRARHKVLGMLFLASIVTYLDRISIAAAAPHMKEDLGLTTAQMGYVFSAFVFAYGIFEIPSGWLGDRFGPRRVLTRVVLWWSAFTAATGAVRSYFSLLACRFLFGAGEAGFFPNSSCAISRWFPFGERARAQGIVWTASRLGAALTPAIALPLQAWLGWRPVFFLFGATGLLWAIPWYLWFRDYPGQKAGVSAPELLEIGESGPAPHASLSWKVALSSANLWAVMLMYHTYCYAAYWFFSWMPTYLVKAKGIEAFATYAALPYLMGAAANVAGGYTSDFMVRKVGLKWGRRSVGLVSMASAGGFMLLSIILQNKLLAIIALSLSFAVSDFMLPNCWAVCLDIGKRYAGTVSGAMNMAGQMGSTIAAAAYGSLVEKHGWNLPLAGMAALSLASALIWLRIDPTKQLVPEKQPALAPQS
ncbi:MAG TPA: MFS transporter [Bryobacterales bacterium]|jgi:ACS family glucarate transporter-like MFS transporter|nr:MFS transporter [Bryobacterales bacterium]